MKGIFPFLVAAVIISAAFHSCYDDDENRTHLSRTEAFGDKYKNHRQNADSSSRSGVQKDTTVYITGVEFDEDYDWRRDSLLGGTGGRIFLMRNGERVMAVEAGKGAHASTDPDKHHLEDGHIYTEFCDKSATYIGKDGKELFSYPGREVLRGLIVDGDDIYTLGQGLDGQGLALRRNGETVFSCKDGNVSGQMLDSPDYPSGALYMDNGHMYFCYWRPEIAGSAKRVWFIVEDGRETQFNYEGDGLIGIRVAGGEVKVEPLTAKRSILTRFTADCAVAAYQSGIIMIEAPYMERAEYTKEPYYYFSYRNSCMCGGTLYLAITPYDKEKASIMWKNGAVHELDFNGFLTGISASILPRENP